MTGENFRAKFARNAIPVVIAVVVMALILVTIPLTSTPAKVFGGYGWRSGLDAVNNPGGGTQWFKYASFTPLAPGIGASSGNVVTLATVALNPAAIQGSDVNFAAFTLDGVPVASWSLSGDGEWILNFKLDGLYAAGDVVTLAGKYPDGTVFTVSVTVK